MTLPAAAGTGSSGADRAETHTRRILAVGGGKGGVGKTLLAANLAIYLAQIGRRVAALDADLGGGNLHTFLGVERPQASLGDLRSGGASRLAEIVLPTGVSGLGLISGECETLAAGARPASDRAWTLDDVLGELDTDYLVIDLPPGTAASTLDIFLAADVGLLVTVPEPTSVEHAVRFIRSAFLRQALAIAGVAELLSRLDSHGCEGGMPTALDLYVAAEEDPELAARILAAIEHFRPRLVLNQARTRADQELGVALRSSARRRLGLAVEYLGYLEADDAVWLAVRRQRPLLVEHAEARVSKGIERIARKVLALEGSERPHPVAPPRPPQRLTHYEVLDLEPGAAEEDVRRAYRRTREIYAFGAMSTLGLYSNQRLESMQRRIEEAYDVLIDPERRRRYDLEIFPEGTGQHPQQPGVDRLSPGLLRMPSENEPELGPESEYSGGLLRQIREARAIELADIAQRTRIGVGHLRAIEGEEYGRMPAQVYLRGFLVEYARCLGLDVARVVDTYLARYRRAGANSEQ